MKNKINGFILIILSVFMLFVTCSMFGDTEDLRKKAEEANKPATVPVIDFETQPASYTIVYEGTISGSLSVNVSVSGGVSTLSYQWYRSIDPAHSEAVLDATGPNFTIPKTLTEGTYYYFCEVSGTNGVVSAKSDPATVFVDHAKTVTLGDYSGKLLASSGGIVTFSITTVSIADEELGLVQWYSDPAGTNSVTKPDWVSNADVSDISGNSATVIISATAPIAENPDYYFRVSFDSIASAAVELVVIYGAGTEADPFKVRKETELRKVGSDIDGWTLSAHYEQTADIHLPEVNEGESNWTPIGGSYSSFTGTYNGRNKTISNLTMNSIVDNQGLFGSIGEDGVVENCHVISGSICGYYYTGGVAGVNNGKVVNCSFSGSVNGVNNVGGLVGRNEGGGVVTGCSFISGSVCGIDNTGGIAGQSLGKVENCNSSGSVTGLYFTGGVVGCNTTGTVKDCYYSGDSVSGSEHIGGITGYNEDGGTVTNCYATGNIEGNEDIGGIAGKNSPDISTVQDCVALNITISCSSDSVGRVAGANEGTLINNYSSADIPGEWNNKDPDAIDGEDINQAGAEFTVDFWITAANWSGGAWSGDVWIIEEGSLPRLVWEEGANAEMRGGTSPIWR